MAAPARERTLLLSGNFTITIAFGSTSNTGTFTLTATADSDFERTETVKVAGRTSLSGSSVPGTEVSGAEMRITDPPGVRIVPGRLTVAEGESQSYTVELSTRSNGTVTIVPSSDDSGASSISPATLTFTTANWDTAQTVTVTGVEDDDASDETVSISHGVMGYTGVTSAPSVTVTVTDDEAGGAPVITVPLRVPCAGGAGRGPVGDYGCRRCDRPG